jgi:hypothetical protein
MLYDMVDISVYDGCAKADDDCIRPLSRAIIDGSDPADRDRLMARLMARAEAARGWRVATDAGLRTRIKQALDRCASRDFDHPKAAAPALTTVLALAPADLFVDFWRRAPDLPLLTYQVKDGVDGVRARARLRFAERVDALVELFNQRSKVRLAVRQLRPS